MGENPTCSLVDENGNCTECIAGYSGSTCQICAGSNLNHIFETQSCSCNERQLQCAIGSACMPNVLITQEYLCKKPLVNAAAQDMNTYFCKISETEIVSISYPNYCAQSLSGGYVISKCGLDSDNLTGDMYCYCTSNAQFNIHQGSICTTNQHCRKSTESTYICVNKCLPGYKSCLSCKDAYNCKTCNSESLITLGTDGYVYCRSKLLSKCDKNCYNCSGEYCLQCYDGFTLDDGNLHCVAIRKNTVNWVLIGCICGATVFAILIYVITQAIYCQQKKCIIRGRNMKERSAPDVIS